LTESFRLLLITSTTKCRNQTKIFKTI